MVSPTVSELRQQRFDALYAEQHAAVFGYVLRRAASLNAAADAIAATFLAAWYELDVAGRGPRCRLWLYGIARQELTDQRHGARRRIQFAQRLASELAAHPSGAADPPQAPTSKGLAELQRAFRSLPERDRELLELEAWEQLDGAQIAVALGCSNGAARHHLQNAHRRLQTVIGLDQPAVVAVQLAPAELISDAGAADMLSPSGHAELLEAILGTPLETPSGWRAWRKRRNLHHNP